MNSAFCDGHEELRDIALETSNDLKHLKEELHVSNTNITRFMSALDDSNKRITYLEIHGAKISQDTAEDVALLREEFEVISKDVALQKNDSGWTCRISSYVLGIISGLIIDVVIVFVLGGI